MTDTQAQMLSWMFLVCYRGEIQHICCILSGVNCTATVATATAKIAKLPHGRLEIGKDSGSARLT